MNTLEKKIFIEDLCQRIKEELTDKVDELPEDWDGHELLVWVADKFAQSASMSLIKQYPQRKRSRDYRNAVNFLCI